MKKTTTIAVWLFMLISISSCKEKGDCCSDIDTYFSIRVLNKDGLSLMNPKTPNAYSHQMISISILIDGKELQSYVNGPTAPILRFDKVQSAEEDYLVGILPGLFSKSSLVTHVIRWDIGNQDTIVCQIKRIGGSAVCEKIWFNGQVKYDATSNPQIKDKSGPGRFFQVGK